MEANCDVVLTNKKLTVYTVDYLSSLLLASWSELYELGVAGVSSQDSSGELKEKIYNNCVMAK